MVDATGVENFNGKASILSALVERDLTQTDVVQNEPDFADRVQELQKVIERVLVIDFSSFCDFLLKLSKDERTEATSQLGNVFNSCIGGMIRSPQISKVLSLFGCRFSNAACLRGYKLQQLLSDIELGDLQQNKIIPRDCRFPIDTMFIDLDNTRDSDIGSLGAITAEISRLRNQQKIKLTLVVLLSEENTIKSIIEKSFTSEKERLYILTSNSPY